MTLQRVALGVAALVLVSLAVVRAADPSGRWAATFTTDIGEQQYTYEFVVKGSTLTGTAKGSLTGETKIADGKVEGDTITFVENASFMEMPIKITYSGTMTSADEIQFTRNVADIANEKLVATRVK